MTDYRTFTLNRWRDYAEQSAIYHLKACEYRDGGKPASACYWQFLAAAYHVMACKARERCTAE